MTVPALLAAIVANPVASRRDGDQERIVLRLLESNRNQGGPVSTIENTNPGAFVSLSQAAETLSISVPTLRRRIAAGELPAFRSGRRIIRIRVSDLEAILRRVPSAGHW